MKNEDTLTDLELRPELRPRRVLLICPTPWDRAALSAPALGVPWVVSTPRGRYTVEVACEELLETPPLEEGLFFDAVGYLRRLVDHYRDDGLDGVIGTDDLPASIFAAYVAAELGLPGPNLEVMLRLSHKVYSRELQARLIPEATPAFEVIDPMDVGARAKRLAFPFFTKPVKGCLSIRAQPVASEAALEAALFTPYLERLRVRAWLRPFQQLLDARGLSRVAADLFIGEALLSGEQVTVDGFVERGRVTIMGVVDSIMYPGTRSFRRFEYPSRLPEAVIARLADVVRRLIEGSGLDHTCFNVELFYDPEGDRVHVIEVNPRMSYQFAELYARVDGVSTYAVQLALATSTPVSWRPGGGPDGKAASLVLRRFEDARVLRVPGPSALARFSERFPGTTVHVLAEQGGLLSDLAQDVGSYRYAVATLSAPDGEALDRRAEAVTRALEAEFLFEDVEPPTVLMPRR